jgi:hypothetical protein
VTAGDAGRARLVLDPGANAASAGDRIDALTAEPASLLAVLYRDDLAAVTEALAARSDRVESAAVVAVGADATDHEAVRSVPDPTDLTGVGIAVGEWVRTREASDRPVVYVDSLSPVLRLAGDERAFRFLHALTGRCRTAGVDAVAYVDPTAHDERTLATIRQVFDCQRRADEAESAAGGRPVATDGGANRSE